MNTDAPWPTLEEAEARVLGIQTKLHQWATDSPDRRFSDLFNLVCDPAFLAVGVGSCAGQSGRTVGRGRWRETSRHRLRHDTVLSHAARDLKAGRFVPLPVRERMIPKASGNSAASASRPRGTAACKPA